MKPTIRRAFLPETGRFVWSCAGAFVCCYADTIGAAYAGWQEHEANHAREITNYQRRRLGRWADIYRKGLH